MQITISPSLYGRYALDVTPQELEVLQSVFKKARNVNMDAKADYNYRYADDKRGVKLNMEVLDHEILDYIPPAPVIEAAPEEPRIVVDPAPGYMTPRDDDDNPF